MVRYTDIKLYSKKNWPVAALSLTQKVVFWPRIETIFRVYNGSIYCSTLRIDICKQFLLLTLTVILKVLSKLAVLSILLWLCPVVLFSSAIRSVIFLTDLRFPRRWLASSSEIRCRALIQGSEGHHHHHHHHVVRMNWCAALWPLAISDLHSMV